MGPESGNGYITYLDGTPITTGPLTEITLDADAPKPDSVLGDLSSLSFKMAFKLKTPKRWRCRSRKRFIKLMMSEGISRNYAEWLADFVRGADAVWRGVETIRYVQFLGNQGGVSP